MCRSSALYLAAQRNNWDAVAELLSCPGIDVSLADLRGNTALHVAASGDQEAPKTIIEEFIKAERASIVNLLNSAGCTALHGATLRGYLGTVKILLAHGATIDAQSSGEGLTALHLAVVGGHFEIIKTLLTQGANPTIRDRQGNTADKLAPPGSSPEIVNLLKQYQDMWEKSPRPARPTPEERKNPASAQASPLPQPPSSSRLTLFSNPPAPPHLHRYQSQFLMMGWKWKSQLEKGRVKIYRIKIHRVKILRYKDREVPLASLRVPHPTKIVGKYQKRRTISVCVAQTRKWLEQSPPFLKGGIALVSLEAKRGNPGSPSFLDCRASEQ